MHGNVDDLGILNHLPGPILIPRVRLQKRLQTSV